LPEQLPQSKHPLAAAHPEAFRACVSCRRFRWRCAWGMLIASGCTLILFSCVWAFSLIWYERPASASNVSLVLFWATLLFLFASFLVVVISTVVRFLIIAIFFTRYSLAQLLGVALFTGTCGTAIARLQGPWKLWPILGLWALAWVIWGYVILQDPEEALYTPAFLRRALARKNASAGSANTESGR